VERSDAFDAWDDPGDDAGDDSFYAAAPLPPHERTWRHPSELGQNAWMLSEPPVAIGRGLLVTTGAIGCVLGIAVLWLLVPIGGGLAPTAGTPTVTSSTGLRGIVSVPTSTPQADLVDHESSTSTVAHSSITLPSEDVPLNTVLVSRPAVDDTERAPEAVAVAVSVDDQPFIVTTANAVADSEAFSIVSTGDPSDGSIVAIDGDLAYLSSASDLGVTAFTSTDSADVGEMVMVLGQEQTPIHFVTGGAVPELDAAAVREGTPVIDDAGALVALCTLVKGTDGSYVALVPIAPPPQSAPTTTSTTVAPSSTTTSTTTPASTTTTAPAPVPWAGVKFGDVAPDAAPVVAGVSGDGPAAAAGLLAGDRIVAVDGKPVSRVDEVLAAIKAKAPGASIVFTVVSGTPLPNPPGGTTTSTSTSTSTTVVAATTTTVAPSTHDGTVVLGVYEPTV
jgi:hypothetical protein